MNLPASFTNNGGEYWQINITYGDIIRVRQHVMGVDGKPLDLCYIAETGDFRQVTDHINIVVKCVYWLLYPQLKESYVMDGVELQEWFYNHIDGDTIADMGKALYEAIVNFTPSLAVKTAMITAGELMTQAQLVAAIESLVGQLNGCTNTQDSLESIPQDSPSGSLHRWLCTV